MTQAELGDSLNVTYQAVSKWERGESHPDFETISKIAKLYGVPITYFEEGGEEEMALAQAEPPKVEQPKTIGVCTCCGKMLIEGEQVRGVPKLICQTCYDKNKRDEEEKRRKAKQEEERKRQEEAKKKQLEEEMRQAAIKKRRNRGLIIAIFPAALALIILIVNCFKYNSAPQIDWLIPLTIFLPIFLYTYVSQLFWDGAVLYLSLSGVRLTQRFGFIFSLDWDGIKLLILFKLIFAIVKTLVFLFTWGFCVALAIAISPFTFFPSLARVNRGED